MFHGRRMTLAAVFCLTCSFLIGSAAGAGVLDQAPADAWLVLKVKNLTQTSQAIAKLSQDWGVAMMAPPLADPLGTLQEELQINQGLDVNGDMAFIMVNPDAVGGRPDQAMLILLPVSDYDGFIKNFGNPQVNGDVTQVAIGPRGMPGFIAHWGQYAAMSPNVKLVSEKPAGIKAPGVVQSRLDDQDMVLMANIQAMRAKVLPEFQKNRENMQRTMERDMKRSGADPAAIPAIRASLDVVMNGVQRILQETQATTLGLKFTDTGLKVNMLAEFEPGTYSGKMVAGLKTSADSLLGGLPSGSYIAYGGMVIDGEAINTLIDDASAPILKEVGAGAPEKQKAINDYVAAMKQFVLSATAQTFGLLSPQGNVGESAMIQGLTVMTGDSAAMMQEWRKAMALENDLMKAFTPEGGALVTTTLTEQAKTIEGVTFDQFQADMKADNATPEQKQITDLMKLMYGPNGMSGLIGAVDARHAISLIGVDDAMAAKAIAAVREGVAPVAEAAALAEVTQNLPAKRVGVVYVALDEMARAGMHVAEQFGFAAGKNVKLPPNLPPMGMSLGTEKSAVQVDVYIPSQTIRSIIAAGMQAMMEGQQGGGAGGAGGPGAAPGPDGQ